MNSKWKKKPDTITKCYQCSEREKGVTGEAQMRRLVAPELHRGLGSVGGPWHGLKLAGGSGGGLQNILKQTEGNQRRRRKLEAGLHSRKLPGARPTISEAFCSRSGESGLELAREDGSAAELTRCKKKQNPILRARKAYRKRN